MNITVNIAPLYPLSRLPTYSRDTDAGLDVYSMQEHTIQPGWQVLVCSGFAVEVPAGWAMFVLPRSGMSWRDWAEVGNAPGTVDPGYTGEVKIHIRNVGPRPINIQPGDRIAQVVFLQVPRVTWNVIRPDEMKSTERGAAGHGSSDVKSA